MAGQKLAILGLMLLLSYAAAEDACAQHDCAEAPPGLSFVQLRAKAHEKNFENLQSGAEQKLKQKENPEQQQTTEQEHEPTLELAQAMKMYAKTRSDITSEGEKAMAHRRWGSKFMEAVCSMLESAPTESSLLQGVKNLVGISKLQEDYAQMCKTVITGEVACAARAKVVVNLPDDCAGNAASCASASSFAQTIASDAEALSEYAWCASNSAKNDLEAFNNFVDGATGLGRCIGVCQWLKSFSVDTSGLSAAEVDLAAVAGESKTLSTTLKGLDAPTIPLLSQYAEQVQSIVDQLDKVETKLMLSEANNCKIGAGYLSYLPSSLTSEASGLMNDCSSNCETFAAMLGR